MGTKARISNTSKGKKSKVSHRDTTLHLPSTTHSTRRSRRFRKETSGPAAETETNTNEQEEIPPIKPAWSLFNEHVREVSMFNTAIGERKEAFSHLSSHLYSKVVRDLKAQDIRKRAKTLVFQRRGLNMMKPGPMEEKEENESESDNDDFVDEAELVPQRRRQETARQHWGAVRRYVNDRIKQRKMSRRGWNKDRALNQLRARAMVSVKPDEMRRELLERYGVVPRLGQSHPEDIMKPIFPSRAKEIIATFERIEVTSLRDRSKSSQLARSHEEIKRIYRSKTSHTYTKPLML